jgi:hypothetical protein
MKIEVFERTHQRQGKPTRRGYFRVRAGNGEVLMQCAKREGYSTRAGARRAARRLLAAIDTGPVEVVER